MDHKRILELALDALQHRKTQVEAEVEALRAEMGDISRSTSTRKVEPSARPKGTRRAKTPAERKAQSKRMKAHIGPQRRPRWRRRRERPLTLHSIQPPVWRFYPPVNGSSPTAPGHHWRHPLTEDRPAVGSNRCSLDHRTQSLRSSWPCPRRGHRSGKPTWRNEPEP